jgi:hypothetical protein
VRALGRNDLDIGDAAAVREVVGEFAPAVIINAAGYTAVDKADQRVSMHGKEARHYESAKARQSVLSRQILRSPMPGWQVTLRLQSTARLAFYTHDTYSRNEHSFCGAPSLRAVPGAQYWLFTLYDKSEIDDLTARQRTALSGLLVNECRARAGNG